MMNDYSSIAFDGVPPGVSVQGHNELMGQIEGYIKNTSNGVNQITEALENSLGLEVGGLDKALERDAAAKAKDTMLNTAKEVAATIGIESLSKELGQPSVQYSGVSDISNKPELGVNK